MVCPAVGPTGSVGCSGVAAEPGVFPQLGGPVGLRLLAATPTATATPLPAVGVLAPPVFPPPVALLPPPGAPAGRPPVGAEVPLIPEADSLALLALGALALALSWTLRRR